MSITNTPSVTTETLLRAYDLTSVATTGATASTPYGFTEAQANAIVTQLNAVIALLKADGAAAIQ